MELSGNIFKQLPENIDYENTKKILSVDPSPLNVVLLQEIERYNALLDMIRKQLQDLDRGIQGLVVMSNELEEIFTCIFDARVPPSWEKVRYCREAKVGSFVKYWLVQWMPNLRSGLWSDIIPDIIRPAVRRGHGTCTVRCLILWNGLLQITLKLLDEL